VSRDDEDGEGAAAAASVVDEGPYPDEAFESRATSEDVRQAIRVLPEGPRQVLLLRIEGDMSFKEIAEEMSIPLGTALTWMRTATRKLRDLLGGMK
jgi:RNA polymerase sigma-70 factor (ECF subfamily)